MGFLIAAGATLLGAAMSADASKSAANTQANAANNATNAQQGMFNTINSQNAPQRNAGYAALGDILKGFNLGGPYTVGGTSTGTPSDPAATAWRQAQLSANPGGFMDTMPDGQQFFNTTGQDPAGTSTMTGGTPDPSAGYFSHQFNADDLKSSLAPNYQFMLNQGLGQASNGFNSTGGIMSGNAQQGLAKYAEDYAGNAYQNAFSNYTGQQQNIFNRLSTIAGFGSTANSTVANSGSSIIPGIASSIQGAGAAQAAGTVGSANAISGGFSNAAGYNLLSNMIRGGGGGGGGGTQFQSGSVPNTGENWLPT